MTSWLDLFLESTKESEAPRRYFWWAGLSAISAVIKKNIYVQRGPFYKLYPNIYVALVSARSGLRKGIPISIVKSLVQELDSVRVISGCNSIEGVISELAQQKTFKSGSVLGDAHGFLVSDEFESFLVENNRALTYLTALHNTHEHTEDWVKHLKHSPIEQLKSPCLSLLVASNEALFDSVVKQKDIEGGFIARTFIVHESARSKINSLMYNDEQINKILEEDTKNHIELMARLRQISMLSGKMIFSPMAMILYEKWYTDLCNSDSDDKTGTFDRLGDQVIKVAILVALSNHNELIIEKRDLEKAIDESERCLPGVREVSLERERGEINPVIEKVLKVLIKAPNQEITRQKLMIQTHIESIILDRALDTLIQRGAILEPKRYDSSSKDKGKIYYKMAKETYETYIKFKIEERKVN